MAVRTCLAGAHEFDSQFRPHRLIRELRTVTVFQAPAGRPLGMNLVLVIVLAVASALSQVVTLVFVANLPFAEKLPLVEKGAVVQKTDLSRCAAPPVHAVRV